MEKQKKVATQLGKIILVLLMLFSETNAPLIALAEEIRQETPTEEKENNTKTNVEENSNEKPSIEETTENPSQPETTTEEKPTEEPSQPETTPEAKTPEEPTQPETTTEEKTTEENTATNETTTEEQSTPEEESSTYKVTINGEETAEYTVTEDNKTVTIHQEYSGEEGTYKFSNTKETEDFTNKLYGTYKLTYSVLSLTDEVLETKEITINYNGNNNEILQELTESATIEEKNITLNGKKENLKVKEILDNFDLETLKNKYNAELKIKDENGNILEEESLVIDNIPRIVLTNGEVEEEYTISIIGDYTNDKKLNEDDANTIIDLILSGDYQDEEGKPLYSILDATNSVYTTGIWNSPFTPQDTLTNSLVNKTQIYVGDELTVKYYINGFEFDKLSGIEGKINYNKEVLELTGIEIESKYGNVDLSNNIGKFAYLLDDYAKEDILMTIKFTALASGTSNISIDEIIGSYFGQKLNLEESVSTTVTVEDYGKGGDDDNEETTPQEQTTTSTEQTQPTVPTTTVAPQRNTTSYIRPVVLSSDSLIKSLEVKGYKLDFNPNKFDYSLKVKNSTTSLDLTIVLSNANATYKVNGNENFKVGQNTVEIVVTAEDGSTSKYTIKVEREKSKKKASEEKEEEENNSSKGIIIALIVLVIIGLIYVIFKDDDEEKDEK